MTELSDTKLKRLVGKAVNEANAAADELEALGAPAEAVRLIRPRATAEPEYKQINIQAYTVKMGDKIEIGGHLTEVIGIDVSFGSDEDNANEVVIHALDPASRVYELKTKSFHSILVQRKK